MSYIMERFTNIRSNKPVKSLDRGLYATFVLAHLISYFSFRDPGWLIGTVMLPQFLFWTINGIFGSLWLTAWIGMYTQRYLLSAGTAFIMLVVYEVNQIPDNHSHSLDWLDIGAYLLVITCYTALRIYLNTFAQRK